MNKRNQKKRGSGFRIVLIFLLIIVGASALLTGGIFPKLTNSIPPNQGQEYIPITPNPGEINQSNDSLQLKTIKFTQKACGKIIAVDFLLDRSGSMLGDKISKLKSGVLTFTNSLTDTSVLGMQDFSSPENRAAGTVKVLVPFSKFKDIKTQVPSLVNSMDANGWTYTRDAFIFTNAKLEEAIPKYPDYKFALIFVSDGVPETGICSRMEQLAGTCTSEQNPNTAPSIADEIKAKGVRIFSIAYLDRNDTRWNSQLETLMKTVASSPNDFYVAPSSNQIDSILNQIATKLCQ